MSVLGEYPEAVSNKKDLQVWNNAAFDNGGDSVGLNSNNLIKSPSWLPLKNPAYVNPSSDSLDSSLSSKENRSPSGLSKPAVSVSARSPVLHQSKPLKNLPIKQDVLDEKTDEEIEIEKEISRLLVRLESLRLKRAEQNAKNLEKPGRTVAAKFMEPVKNRDSGVKKIEESDFSRTKIQRRGFSLGPNEIMSATSSKSKQSGTTPIQSTQNRRKSCFWKLQDIEEEEQTGFSRGKNLSLRQAVTTVGSKKRMKKDDSVLSSVQPKKLFGEQSVPAKKPLKPGRVVASRYNQATVNSSMRKRSLPDNIVDRKPCGTEGRVKKKWEIPTEIVVPKRLDLDDNDNEDFLGSIDVVMPGVLPRIRAVRCVDEADRDSGPAKRVAELVGKKSYFGSVDEETAVCQKLSFEED